MTTVKELIEELQKATLQMPLIADSEVVGPHGVKLNGDVVYHMGGGPTELTAPKPKTARVLVHLNLAVKYHEDPREAAMGMIPSELRGAIALVDVIEEES